MINFDNNAETVVAPEVLEAMEQITDSKQVAGAARMSIAELLGVADPGRIAFTPGGSESNRLAILGALKSYPEKRHIVTTSVENGSVRTICENLEREGFSVTRLEVNESGSIDLDELKSVLRTDTVLVSIGFASDETGVILPVAEAAKLVREHSDALFHTDAVAAAGKFAIDVEKTHIDLLSIAGHMFHGPRGVGALYIRGGASALTSDEFDGLREIAGIGAAADLVKDVSIMDDVRRLRDRIENEILQKIPNSRLNGGAARLPNTSNISFENTNGEMIAHRLFESGILVSTGSACSGADHKASEVLQAMNVPYSEAMGSIRFSLSRYSPDAEAAELLDKLPGIVENLHAMAV